MSDIANEFVERKDKGESIDSLREWLAGTDYNDQEESYKKKVEKERRRLEVEPFDTFFKENAEKYGFKYTFTKSNNDAVEQYRERKRNRLNARLDAEEDGQWITTESGQKVHLNEEGEPDKGNTHVVAVMNGNDPKGPRPSSRISYKKSVLEKKEIEEYNKRFAEVTKKMNEANARIKFEEKSLDKDQKGIPYHKKDFSKIHEARAEWEKVLVEFEGVVKELPVGTLLSRYGMLYEKTDSGWMAESPRESGEPISEKLFIQQMKCTGYIEDVKPLECIESTNDLKMVQSLTMKSDETYRSFAEDINNLDKKSVVARAKKDPEFKELVDAITIYTQGGYTDQKKEAKYLVQNGTDEALIDTVGDYCRDGFYEIKQLWNGQKLSTSESSFSGGVLSMIGAINNSEKTTEELYRIADDRSILQSFEEVKSLYKPPNIGDIIKMDAPTSFTKDREVMGEIVKYKYGDVIRYNLEHGAHALDI